MSLDARGRIMAGDPRYGRICGCGELKGWQARWCWACEIERRRDDAFWRRRTCPDCGGPKSVKGIRCLRCENARRVGKTGHGREQPPDHPWRRAA